MVSLLSHASGLIGGRADERICIGRLTVDRVFIVLPVMAYSVGLERPFPTGYEAMGLQLNPGRVSFSVSNDAKAAGTAAATSRAATSTKMVTAHGMPNRRVTALQFIFFMFLCMYTTILDLGYVNFLARDTTGDCAWRSISGVNI